MLQAGSLYRHTGFVLISPIFASLSTEELITIEKLVNREIMRVIPVEVIETTYNHAREMGAIALFGEKYEDKAE